MASLKLLVVVITAVISTTAAASIPRVPSETLVFHQPSSNFTPSLSVWPTVPFSVPLHGTLEADRLNFILVFDSYSPRSPKSKALMTMLQQLISFVGSHGQRTDPVQYTMDIREGFVLNLRPSLGHAPVTRQDFLEVLEAVSVMFRNHGAASFASKVEGGEREILASFELFEYRPGISIYNPLFTDPTMSMAK